MFEAKLPHALVVTLGEYGPPGLAHACDRGDRRLEKLAPGQFVAGAVLEQANFQLDDGKGSGVAVERDGTTVPMGTYRLLI
ncbi:MAG TPA: hypothetical protein VKU77_13215 [Streptosporangiaceae bacterium]|nr:hypothetical protein [Streptosporangiaceae bacterium]